MAKLDLAHPPATWLINAMAAIGIDIKNLPLPPQQKAAIQQHNSTSPATTFEDYQAILHYAGQYSGDSEIGLRLSDHIDDRELGLYGYLLLNASSIGEYLYIAARYHSAMGNHCIAKFHQGEHSSRLEYEVFVPSQYSTKHDITLTLSRRLQFIRDHLHDEWRPKGACFSFAEPDDLSEYHRHFGDNILFNQATNFIEIDNRYLDVTINDTDPQLLDIIRAQADEILENTAASNDIVNRVKMQLMNRIGMQEASQEKIARQLNMSRATLQRRLEAKGKPFRKLRDEIIYQLSTRALTETEAKISEIALKVGYSELSAFDHAFKRLSGGITPLQYRQRFKAG